MIVWLASGTSVVSSFRDMSFSFADISGSSADMYTQRQTLPQSTSEDTYSNRQTSGTPERAQALLGICMALLRICMALFVLSKALLQISVHNDRRYSGHERGE